MTAPVAESRMPDLADHFLIIEASRRVDAPAETAYAIIANYREHHPKILPPQFGDFEVLEGGVGEGTVIRFSMTIKGRKNFGTMHIAEPEPGRLLVESDPESGLVTEFHVDPLSGGSCEVTFKTYGRRIGQVPRFMGRFVEWSVASVYRRALRPIYQDELQRLDRYAQELSMGNINV